MHWKERLRRNDNIRESLEEHLNNKNPLLNFKGLVRINNLNEINVNDSIIVLEDDNTFSLGHIDYLEKYNSGGFIYIGSKYTPSFNFTKGRIELIRSKEFEDDDGWGGPPGWDLYQEKADQGRYYKIS